MTLPVSSPSLDGHESASIPRIDQSHPQYADYLERLKTWEGLPVTVAELESILGSARSMPPESLDGVPANLWWPALVLTIVNSAHFAPDLLDLSFEAYDRDAGILRIKRQRIRLHAHTAHALDAIQKYERDQLFPWPKDGGKRPHFMLYHDFQNLLHRAGLPAMQKRPMAKLRKLGERYPQVLDCIDPNRPFHPVEGFPFRKPKRKRRRKLRKRLFKSDSEDTLQRYFSDVYQPLRLIGCSSRTPDGYLGMISGFSVFLGRAATLQDLTDESVGRYQAWMSQKGYQPNTINSHTRHLLALWRHAWKKRRVEELPRDVEFVRVLKRIPEAWSTAELARILEAAAKAEGQFRRIPANLFWLALILLMYDTGLRLGAVMLLRTEEFNLENGLLIARAETQKQKADQLFRVHSETLEAIRAISPERREFLFNFPNYRNSKSSLYAAFTKILKAAGLPSGDRDKFHKLRRTSATYLADAIGPEEAQKHLGHSSMQITQGYLDLTKINSRVNAADVMVRPVYESGGEP